MVWKNLQTKEYKYFYKENLFENVKIIETYTIDNDKPFVAVLEDKDIINKSNSNTQYIKIKRNTFEQKERKILKITILSLS